jgi:transcriptional antiterminator RfaH
MRKWYLVYAKPRQEKLAEVNLQRQGYEVWLPRIRASRPRGGRWIETVEPLFPRYLLIRLDAGGDNFGPIRSTRGVSTMVRLGVEPAVVPDPVVDRLSRAADPHSGLLLPPLAALRRGDPVQVLDGPFQGWRASFRRNPVMNGC